MFPDTANFNDPMYTSGDPTSDPLDPTGGISYINTSDPAYQAMLAGNVSPISPDDPAYKAMLAGSTGGASSNTPAQSATSGSSLLGWLGLANNVANTAVNANRTGATTRPGTTAKTTALSSFGTMTTTTLLVIVAIFVGVVFMLRKQ